MTDELEHDDWFTLETMEVDGILSTRDIEDWSGPMFSLVKDRPVPPSMRRFYRQQWNNPPTEEELDLWIKDEMEF